MTTTPTPPIAEIDARTQYDHDPVRLCALADLLLLAIEPLRPPEVSSPQASVILEDLEGLFKAAGIAPDEPLAVALRNSLDLSTRTDPSVRVDEHHRLFEGAIVCPLNQTAWVRRDKGVILGDLCGFYRAFGFEPTTQAGEKADHLIPQLEFLALLLVMLAKAQGDDRQITRDALHEYAQVHLCDWISGVWQRLAQVAATELHLSAAESLRLTWEHVSNQLRLPPTATTLTFDDKSGSDDGDDRDACAGGTGSERVELRCSAGQSPTPPDPSDDNLPQ